MKYSFKLSDLTQNDLVELFSSALNGNWFKASWNTEDKSVITDKNDCFEDVIAKHLLAGNKIELYDYFAEDEKDYHGKLQHKWDSEREAMVYYATIDDITKGLEKAMKKGGYSATCMWYFINYEDGMYGMFDWDHAETLMQFIMFGEEIYG
jgi:hypothetical protein